MAEMMQWEQRIRAGADSPKLSEMVRADFRACIAEIDALRKDAERYRKVRRGQHWSVIDWAGETLQGESLDAAVDAKPAVGAA